MLLFEEKKKIDVIDDGYLYYNIPDLRPSQAQSCTSRLRPLYFRREWTKSTAKIGKADFCCAFCPFSAEMRNFLFAAPAPGFG
jgi:hypothetical protein